MWFIGVPLAGSSHLATVNSGGTPAGSRTVVSVFSNREGRPNPLLHSPSAVLKPAIESK